MHTSSFITSELARKNSDDRAIGVHVDVVLHVVCLVKDHIRIIIIFVWVSLYLCFANVYTRHCMLLEAMQLLVEFTFYTVF